MDYFQNLRWVAVPLIGCIVSVLSMIGLLGFFGMESDGNFIKFYCTYVNFEYGHEHSRNSTIFAN